MSEHSHSAGRDEEATRRRSQADANGSALTRKMIHIQHSAGNRAAGVLAQRLASDGVATDGPDELSTQAGIGNDLGLLPENMSWEQLKDAIVEHQTFLSSQISSSPEVIEREQRLESLLVAQRAFAQRTRRRKRARGRRSMPERPLSLAGSLAPQMHSGIELKAEIDRIVTYLAAGPTKDERQALEYELPFLEEAVGAERNVAEHQRRGAKLQKALGPTGGSEADQFATMLKRLDSMEPDPAAPEMLLLHFDGEVLPVSIAEANVLRQNVTNGLLRAARSIDMHAGDVHLAWQQRHEHNQDQWIVHGLVGFTTGVEDIPPSELKTMMTTSFGFIGAIRGQAEAGNFSQAGHLLLVQDNYVRYWGEKVGKWESTLVGGAGRWVLALTILKESLGILAGFGAAGLAAKGATLAETLTIGAKIAGASTLVGGMAAGTAAAVTDGDVGDAIRAGGAEGFGVGSEALTAGLGRVASIDDVAKATNRTRKAIALGKAVAVDAGAGIATSVAQAAIAGEDLSDAALSAAVSSPIGTIGGGFVNGAGDRRTNRAIRSAIVGSTSGAAGAAATDGDVKQAAIFGGLGGVHGEIAGGGVTADPSAHAHPTDAAESPAVRPEQDMTEIGNLSAAAPEVVQQPRRADEIELAPASLHPEAETPTQQRHGDEPSMTHPANEASGPVPPVELAGSRPAEHTDIARSLQPSPEVSGPRRLAEVVEHDYGIPVENQQRFETAAETLQMTIKVRPTNPDSVAHLKNGALPKPSDVKAKTINELDVHLGFRAEDVGLVGYRMPDVPQRPANMDDATWRAMGERFNERQAEYGHLERSMSQLVRPVADQTGTSGQHQFAVDSHGVLRVVDPETGTATQAVTGDHDIFELRDIETGMIITDPERLAKASDYLRANCSAVMHDAHINWDTADPTSPEIGQVSQKQHGDETMKTNLIKRHLEREQADRQMAGLTSEPLIVFRPGRPPVIEMAGIGKDY